jgi:O-antigen ligase
MIFEQAPILGVGLRQFAWHHFMVNAQLPAPRVLGLTDHAHNLPLHMLAEFGVIGLAVVAIRRGAVGARTSAASAHAIVLVDLGSGTSCWPCTACSNIRCGTPSSWAPQPSSLVWATHAR